jgi:hypothetical protein
VGVADRSYLRSCAVQRGVQQQPDWIDCSIAPNDVPLVVDLHQLRSAYSVHRHAHRVHPEVVGPFRVADRDVAQQPFRQTASAENAARSREPFADVPPLGLFGGKDRLFTRRKGIDGDRGLHGASPGCLIE